ncbi:VOC family protein [Streptomyces sp. VNUA116]|uniref:VOC family protein n=1 Tax=Streptomyces sp. VNUA116 TaxID=3062449 RepID=UPI00267640C1|nr:VOC family protein [Streptomyces sp. VNUA116]WKU42720.1 VOC family protein [Streptomyces sp. VNUA116]
MITGVNTAAVWVLDQDAAKAFFTDKLGLEVRTDVPFGEGMRWVTVGAEAQPETQISLMVPGPPMMDRESAQQLTSLLGKGVLIGCTFTVEDCHAAFADLSARGVTFVQEPQPRPWGISATLRDVSGTVHEILQPHHQDR